MSDLTTEQLMISSLVVLAIASQAWDKRSIILGWWSDVTQRAVVAPKQCMDSTAHDCLSALRLLKQEALRVDPANARALIAHIDALAPLVLICTKPEKSDEDK
tara:strand:+ start:5466 stop:5774 length:309 start_codon:yes stop_codon:yes gene_type:complete